MNYVEHSIIGVGTAGACVGLMRLAGLPQPDTTGLLVGMVAIVAGALSTDLDHPQAYISRRLPARLLRHLAPPLILLAGFVAGMSFLTQQDIPGNLTRLGQLSLVKWGVGGILLALGLLVISRLLNMSLGHRGALHSLAACAVVTLAAAVLTAWAAGNIKTLWVGALYGYGFTTHVLSDALTPTGVPLWHPFSRRRVRLIGKLKWTGGEWAETRGAEDR